jgi:hypothetical protein
MKTPLQDALVAAQAAENELNAIVARMEHLHALGTRDAHNEALALRPAMFEARQRSKSANERYVHLHDLLKGAARIKSRSEFNRLSPSEKMAFIRLGGELFEE